MNAADFYSKMAELEESRTPFVLATVVKTDGSTPRGPGTKMLVMADGSTIETIGGGALEQQIVQDSLAALSSGVSRIVEYDLSEAGENAVGAACGGGASVFLDVHTAGRTLLIVGAGHVGLKLVSLAKMLDFRVVVLDPREEMLTVERLPEADLLVCGEPARTAELVPIGPSTCVVLVTHGHLHDEEALRSVIESPALYIGMIGSKAKVRGNFATLEREGVSPALLARVHAPIGLDIGAETPAELALCIMAEIIAVQRGRIPTITEMSR
jgi:xanthine dehydrogenase accessory factor